MRKLIVILAAFLLVLLAGLLLLPRPAATVRDIPSAEAPAIGGPFALTDQDGKRVTDQAWRGRYLLVQFGFASCPDICPTQLATISAALDRLPPAKAARVAPLFISVDPARDTPAALKAYLQSFPRVTALTGTPAEIAAVAQAYKVYYARVPNPAAPAYYTVDHTVSLFLMDSEGRFVQLFDRPAPAELAAALDRLIP